MPLQDGVILTGSHKKYGHVVLGDFQDENQFQPGLEIQRS